LAIRQPEVLAPRRAERRSRGFGFGKPLLHGPLLPISPAVMSHSPTLDPIAA